MREIPLTQGKVAIVDEEDADRVLAFKWSATRCRDTGRYYAGRREGRRFVSLHRFILNAPPDRQVDHVNRDGLDNRRSNLRLATPSQNQWNRERRSDNRTGFKGVFAHKSGKWQALIKANRKHIYLGLFDSKEDAARAYDLAALLLHGEFARINFPAESELLRRVLARTQAATAPTRRKRHKAVP